ncbi:MAG: hypothetical protein Q9184_003910 [Pyrenodesmia sp. 2 TL-2023]
MTGYVGRKAPNVSRYLSNLNAIPLEHDIATQQPDDFDFNDLATFTNTEFFDFDQGEHAFHSPIDYGQADQALNAADLTVTGGDPKSGDYDYQFQSLDPFLQQDAPNHGLPGPIQTNFATHPNLASTVPFQSSPSPGSKRTASASTPASTFTQDESSRHAAEEDKRRRNTAASARFRVKKKQREQALEKTAKELNDKTAQLEHKIEQLQTQNEWLKNLITEKKGKDFLAEEWKAFRRRAASESESGEEGVRITDERKKGVGTE